MCKTAALRRRETMQPWNSPYVGWTTDQLLPGRTFIANPPLMLLSPMLSMLNSTITSYSFAMAVMTVQDKIKKRRAISLMWGTNTAAQMRFELFEVHFFFILGVLDSVLAPNSYRINFDRIRGPTRHAPVRSTTRWPQRNARREIRATVVSGSTCKLSVRGVALWHNILRKSYAFL